MNTAVFIETANVTALRDAVKAALGVGQGSPGMVMAYGDAGTGKTKSAMSLYADLGGIYLRTLEGMTQAAFLQSLCYLVDGSRPHGSMRCKTKLLDILRDTPMPIFSDEADRLPPGRLEDLRDIHDLTGCPVVLIGENGLPVQVSARSRINDRIPDAFRIPFGGISTADVMLYAKKAAGLVLSPEAVNIVLERTKGNFRRVYGALLSLERAARTAETGTVDAAMTAAAIGTGKAA